jgi:hypothetical protein
MVMTKTRPRYLTDAVRWFYSICGKNVQALSKTHRRLPDGTLDFVVNLGEPVAIAREEKDFQWMPTVAITGLYSEKCLLKYGSTIHLVGAVLQPGFAHAFVGDSLNNFRGDTHDAAVIFGTEIEILTDLLRGAHSETDRHHLLETFLLKRYRNRLNNYQQHDLQNVLALIHHRKGAIAIGELSRGLYMSERNLRRNFTEHVGLSPKKCINC